MSRLVRQTTPSPLPWTSQPQVPVEIDWSNPITRGLEYHFVGSDGVVRDAAKGIRCTNTGSPSPVIASRGKFLNYVAGSSSALPSLALSGSQQYTISFLLRCDNLSHTTYPEILAVNGWSGFNCHTQSDGVLYIGSDAAGRIATSAGYISVAEGLVLITHVKSSTGQRLYKNGVLTHSNGNTPTITFGTGVIAPNQAWRGIVDNISIFNRALSDAEIKSISANPWQIFKPIKRNYQFDLVRGPVQQRESYLMGTTPPTVSASMPAVVGLKNVWTSQPQVPVEIDWSNPVTRGIRFVFLGNRLLFNTDVAEASRVGRHGIGSYVPSPYGSNNPIVTTGQTGITGTDYSLFAFGSMPNASAFCSAIDDDADSGGTRSFQFRMYQGKAQLISFDTNNNPYSATAVTAITDTQAVSGFAIGASVKGNTLAVYQNGVKADGAASNTQRVPTGDFYIGQHKGTGANGWQGSLYLATGWSRSLSDSEQISLSQNPWQIFRPITKQVLVPA